VKVSFHEISGLPESIRGPEGHEVSFFSRVPASHYSNKGRRKPRVKAPMTLSKYTVLIPSIAPTLSPGERRSFGGGGIAKVTIEAGVDD
jgi:hypothetical protein